MADPRTDNDTWWSGYGSDHPPIYKDMEFGHFGRGTPYLMVFFGVIKDGLKELEDQEYNVHLSENEWLEVMHFLAGVDLLILWRKVHYGNICRLSKGKTHM